MFRVLLATSAFFASAAPTMVKKFETGDKKSLGLVHDAELAWTTTVIHDGSDAETAGIKIGWRLVKVNGEDAGKLSNYALISKLGERPLELEYIAPYQPNAPCDNAAHRALYEAVRTGKVSDVYAHLEVYKCELNTKPADEPLPIMHLAGEVGSMAKIRALHAYGAKVDEDFNGDRPVHFAARKLHAYAAHWLITLGADATNTDASGLPLAHVTAKACANEVMKVLRMKGIDMYSAHNGATPEDVARESCPEDGGLASMLARWTAEKKQKDGDAFVNKLKGAEL